MDGGARRISQLTGHLASDKRLEKKRDMSAFDSVPLAPPDPIFHLTASFVADAAVAEKINLGVGAYRDDSGKPWVLPVVKKVSRLSVAPLLLLWDAHRGI
jgi:hypothetical protein